VSNLGGCRLLFSGLKNGNKCKNFRLNYEKQRTGITKNSDSISGRVKEFFLSKVSTPFTGLTQPSIKWLPEALFPEIKRLEYKVDHILQLVLRLRRSVSITPLLI
jgi:hypothetical protein